MQPTLWQQIYDPFGNMIISTLLGAIPVLVMLVGLWGMYLIKQNQPLARRIRAQAAIIYIATGGIFSRPPA